MISTLSDSLENILNLQRALSNTMGTEWFRGGISSRGGFPPINIFQENENYIIIAEVPGIKREDVAIEVNRNRIRVSGEKKFGYGDNVSVHRRERQEGKYDRVFTTPFEIDADKVKAEYRNGILALYLPPAEQHKPRSINIT